MQSEVMAIWAIMALVALSFIIHIIVYLVRLIKARRNPGSPPFKSRALREHALAAFVILVLCAMAIPNFSETGNRPRPKSYEAKTSLEAIYVAQMAFFSQYHTYAGSPKAFELINWRPASPHFYAYYCDTAIIANKLPLGREMPLPDQNWPVELKPHSSRIGFTCMAVGNIDNDPNLDVWSINDAKILSNEQNDV